NGYLHIGHAKAICLDFGAAAEFGGRCHLRMDDTNPETEDIEYVDAIVRDVRWLGFDWGEHLCYASDYFEQFYDLAEGLIRKGLAYVDSLSEEEIREHRGTVTRPGTPSPYRDRPIDENLELFRRMRAGEFPDGAHVLRARIDLASSNMLMRDPVLYRIRHATHYRRGDVWCLYPLYDYAHPLEDAIECVTHSLCTLEFENNRELYDWVVEHCEVRCRPQQIEFARLELDYTIMSKRKLLRLVEGGHVSGWDDPRMPTIAGLRRRGVTPESIRAFCDLIGIAKTNSRVDIAKLEYAVRGDLNTRAPRVMCVVRPLRVVLTNWPADRVELLEAPYWPHDVPNQGSRAVPFSRTLVIERDDFAEAPPPGFHRLAPGAEVRLRYGYVIRCDDVVMDETGAVVELRCTYDPATRGGATPDGRRVKGTIHWVSEAHSLPCEVRLYDRLFAVPDPEADAGIEGDFTHHLNPDSLVSERDARIEPSIANDPPGSHYQFERLGYFVSDIVDSRAGALVFNRTVTLRDSWAKLSGELDVSAGRPDRSRPSAQPAAAPGAAPVSAPERVFADRSPAAQQRFTRYTRTLALDEESADRIARDDATARLFETALAAGADPQAAANWIVNDLARELAGRSVEDLPFGGEALASFLQLLATSTLSSSGAREVLAEMVERGGDPPAIVERLGLRQISDADALRTVIAEVIAAHGAKVDEYRAGRTGLLGFFTGEVMRRTRGRANPEVVQALLRDRLNR
ncbi:MAG: glutamine--tRNA ligase/YqeY domain fusion protein, partial [Gemmatimonadetes bacterium]|nr:glutamine--tRNA ligase/YqeY domain fusion protein [Gemmatimonadota bacterium]